MQLIYRFYIMKLAKLILNFSRLQAHNILIEQALYIAYQIFSKISFPHRNCQLILELNIGVKHYKSIGIDFKMINK